MHSSLAYRLEERSWQQGAFCEESQTLEQILLFGLLQARCVNLQVFGVGKLYRMVSGGGCYRQVLLRFLMRQFIIHSVHCGFHI